MCRYFAFLMGWMVVSWDILAIRCGDAGWVSGDGGGCGGGRMREEEEEGAENEAYLMEEKDYSVDLGVRDWISGREGS